MLHIFISNRPGQVRYGTTGQPVPGDEIRPPGENGNPVPDGEIGEIQVSGPTAAIRYWNSREPTKNTFLGPCSKPRWWRKRAISRSSSPRPLWCSSKVKVRAMKS